MSKGETIAKSCLLQDQSFINEVEDVYICVFFDGTGNNMYEQYNKGKHLKELREKANRERKQDKVKTSILFSPIDSLFTPASNKFLNSCDVEESEKDRYGMDNYYEQRIQAEKIFTIKNERGNKDSHKIDDNGGSKYSNIAILRSLVKKNMVIEKSEGKTGIVYNLYIEGSGKHWDTDSFYKLNKKEWLVGLGMGTGRTGVVGLVSKAVVFVREFLCSNIDKERRSNVELHFAIFGFSRGATCGRLFSSLIVKGKDTLKREPEFEQFLPINTNYFDNGRVAFLDDFDKKTVDFLGIYDTVSSIGFLQKKDNNTNYGINNYQESPKGEDEKYIGFTEESKQKWYINSLHGSSLVESDVLEIDTPAGPIPSPKVTGTFITDKFWGDAKWNFHRFNVRDYGLDPYKSDKVEHTFHICAIDEFRENFALVDLGDNMETNHCTEIYMPGCHSDIGGGYMYNDKIEEHTLRRIIGKEELPTHMISSLNPRNFGVTGPLSQHVLNDLGWLNAKTKTFTTWQQHEIPSTFGPVIGYDEVTMEEAKYKKKLKDPDINTEGQTTYINQTADKIDFKHFSKEGYSNISLKMMFDRAKGNYGLAKWNNFIPFTKNMPPRFNAEHLFKDSCLKNLRSKFESAVNKPEGRYWIVPDSEPDYVYLRSNYLHFTCTDELHEGADFGNAPNWVSDKDLNSKATATYYVLCRLVYRGNRNDSDLHYWNEPTFKNDQTIK